MESVLIGVVIAVLDFNKIPCCLIGDVVLNYYNVPRVIHIELCVGENNVPHAISALRSTGLFEPAEIGDVNIFTQNKTKFPRLKSTSWIQPVQTVMLSSVSWHGVPLVHDNLVPLKTSLGSKISTTSKEFVDLAAANTSRSWPLPRLPILLVGLCRRYLDTEDDMAMIAAEQLVDGMDIDDSWCERNLSSAGPDAVDLVVNLVREMPSRIDYFSDNKVTCFIKDEEEACKVRLIPGYE